MKYKKSWILITICMFFLTACGSSDGENLQTQDAAVQELQKLLDAGDYAGAYEILKPQYEANELGPSGIELFHEVEKNYAQSSFDLGYQALEKQNYEEALNHLTIAKRYNGNNQDVINLYKQAEYLFHEQENFDFYLREFESMINESNKLLNSFNMGLDDLATDRMDVSAFKMKVQEIIPQSNTMIRKLDDIIYKVDGEVLNIHKDVLSLLHHQHKMFVAALEITLDNRVSLSSSLRNDFWKAKQDQTGVIQRIKNFANEKGLKMTIAIEEEKEE